MFYGTSFCVFSGIGFALSLRKLNVLADTVTLAAAAWTLIG